MFTPDIKPQATITNNELMGIFKCACEGGIRYSKTTRSIVLVVNYTRGGAVDSWQGEILPFTGSGSLGNQTLDKGRNKTLMQAFKSDLPVFLFEVYKQGQYTFKGRVVLAAKPYEICRADKEGNERKVWIFPLKLADS